MKPKLKDCITLLERYTKKKVMFEEFDREDNLYTKSANQVSEDLDILVSDLQQLVTQIANHQELEDFSVETSVFLDQVNEYRTRISQSIVTTNEDDGLEEADMSGQTEGAVRVTTDQVAKNANGKLKPILDSDIDLELTDLN